MDRGRERTRQAVRRRLGLLSRLGHFSTALPGVPTALATAVVHPLTGELLALGGTPPGIAKASATRSGASTAFLAASLR